jgi:hypothetical protein
MLQEGRRMSNEDKRKAEDFWGNVEGGFFLFAYVGAPILVIIQIACAALVGH